MAFVPLIKHRVQWCFATHKDFEIQQVSFSCLLVYFLAAQAVSGVLSEHLYRQVTHIATLLFYGS